MKVRMKVSVSGSRDGKPWPSVGETATVGDEEGADLCTAGLAEPVATKKKTEKATTGKNVEKRKG
jgi:hypothetical protein